MNLSLLSDFLRLLMAPYAPRRLAPPGGGGPPEEAEDVPTAIYRNLMAGMDQGAVVCTTTGDVLDANSLAAPILGLEAEVLEGLPFPTALEEAGCKPTGDPFGQLAAAAERGETMVLEPLPLGERLMLELRSFRVGPQVLVLALLSRKPSRPGSQPTATGPPAAAVAGAGPAAALGGAALEALHQGAVIADAEGRIVDYNTAATRLTGISTPDLLGRPVANLIPPGNPAGMAERLLTHSLSTGSWTGVLRVSTEDGERKLGVATRTLEGDGGRQRILIALRDLGEAGTVSGGGPDPGPLIEAFSGLWQSGAETPPGQERILKEIGSTLGYDLACIEVYDRERNEYEMGVVDARVESRVQPGIRLPGPGSSSDKVRESGLPLPFPDLDLERRWEDLDLFRDFGSGVKFPLRSGEKFLGVLSFWSREKGLFSPGHVASGALPAALLVAADQTAELGRLRSHTQGDDSRERMHLAALDRIGEGVLALDLEGKVLWANRGAERLTGRTRDQLMDTPLAELLGEGSEVIARLGRGGWEGRIDLRHAEGWSRPAQVRLTGTAGDLARGTPLILLMNDIAQMESHEEMVGSLAQQVETAERILAVDLEVPDLGEFLARYTSALQHLVHFEEAQIFVPSEGGEALVLQSAANARKPLLEKELYFPREGTLVGEVSDSAESRVIPDLSAEESIDAAGFLEDGFRSAALLPLPVSDVEAGAARPLLVLLATAEGTFRMEDLPVLNAMCQPVARALEKLGPARRIPDGGASG